jgi:hypothetical protein
MNNNTNHNFTDLLEQDSVQPNHSHCKVCGEFSTDSFVFFDYDDDDAYMTICEDCYEEALAFETKFAKVLGTVKY